MHFGMFSQMRRLPLICFYRGMRRADIIQSNDPEILYEWGNTLSKLSRTEEALKKFEDSEELKTGKTTTFQ